ANAKEQTLMDMATIAGKYLRKEGELDDLDVSDEINACSVEIKVDVNGQDEDWLLMYKNETHNHPTEIEPFGGSSTCIGGAIRDPLSGRSYVYQAMRITGAGDITKPIEETMEHKLPQSTISKTAAHGYSSYGNQIGLATTFVEEVFDEGYVAKRMEVGAVVGAAPKSHVKREK
ncbi:phosphoribosylformylglycinamidine synthase, partial [Bacteroides gallinaceum]|nr:phosphoribosylformylglycinamidine synthase [Bacteroides gallinaceum]